MKTTRGWLRLLEADEDYWRLMEVTGGWWKLLEADGGYWRLMEATGGWWRLLEADGCYWRLIEATRGWKRLLEADRGYWRLTDFASLVKLVPEDVAGLLSCMLLTLQASIYNRGHSCFLSFCKCHFLKKDSIMSKVCHFITWDVELVQNSKCLAGLAFL